MLENWSQWYPINNLSSKYYVQLIVDSLDEFKILLSDAHNESKNIQIVFEESVRAYRSTYESFRQKIINDLGEKYEKKFYAEWTFFKVTNSTYMQWISEQSYDICHVEPLIHFSIIAVDSIVDIIASYEPKVEMIPVKNTKIGNAWIK